LNDRRIDYIEFRATDVAKAKAFYASVFGWKFTDYGPDYTSFEDGRITGGFTLAEGSASGGGNPLVVIYAKDLAEVERAVVAAGGEVLDHIEFPGGKRFHFLDPVGNKLAVWSDKGQ
jgi:predicted enzyme related to lactoylglutathione lyase